jgi:hypothetical protein
MAPKAIAAQLGVGRTGTLLRIGAIVVLACGAVVAALLYVGRGPDDSTKRALEALGSPSASAKAGPAASGATASSGAASGAATTFPIPNIPPPPPATAEPSASAAASAAPEASAAPAASAPAAPAAADEGTVSTPPNAGGHRVFVDGHYAGDSPGPLKVHCGPHVVKVGSGGRPHSVDVPCGGDVVVH